MHMYIGRAAGTWDGDKYLVVADFPSYVDAQQRVDRLKFGLS